VGDAASDAVFFGVLHTDNTFNHATIEHFDGNGTDNVCPLRSGNWLSLT
jgi:hypothetical protein